MRTKCLIMNTYSIARVAKVVMIAVAASVATVIHASDTLTVTFTGDVLLDRGVRRTIERHHGDAGCLFSPSVDSIFASSQLVIANLECPATSINSPALKNFVFRGEPEWLQVLKEHGVTHLNLANNHSIDQGRKGLIDTRDNIINAGMVPIGAGDCMEETSQPVLIASHPRNIYVVASLRLSLENFAYLPDQPCVSQESFEKLEARVRQLREQEPECCIVVCLHWGAEHVLRPAVQQVVQAHRLIDAGADCLICHHTHTMQTVEQYKSASIYYSIGNFIFDQKRDINSRACMVQLTITSTTVEAKTIPVVIKDCVPEVVDDEDS